MRVGNVVQALAGKENGQIFVIVRLDDKYAYLSNGKRLKYDKPKKTSLKHVKLYDEEALTEEALSEKDEKVNALIRKFLSKKRSEHV